MQRAPLADHQQRSRRRESAVRRVARAPHGVDHAALDRSWRPRPGRRARPDRRGPPLRRGPRHQFETFAERRVRGAMIDALRRDAWPRGVRRVRRELEAAREAAAPRAWRRADAGRPGASASAPTRRASNGRSSASTPSNRRRRWRISSVDSATLPAVLVPSEPPSPDRLYRTDAKCATACARRSRSCRRASAGSRASTTSAKRR